MKRKKNLLSVLILVLLLIPTLLSCSNDVNSGVYNPDDIWEVNGETYYKFSDAMAALENKGSKDTEETNTITLIRKVSEFERGEGFVIPETYTEDLEIDLGGYEYWFKDSVDSFINVAGGSAVTIKNGTAVISEKAGSSLASLTVNAESVTLENQIIDDRRTDPNAIELSADSSLDVSTGSEISGSFELADGSQLSVSGGTVYGTEVSVTSSSSNTRVSKIDVTGGTFQAENLTLSAEESGTDKSAQINVTGGTVNITGTLTAEKNSEISFAEATGASINASIEGLVTAGYYGEASSVLIDSGTMTIVNLTVNNKSSVTVNGGTITFSGSIYANDYPDNTGYLTINGGTIMASGETREKVVDALGENSSAVIIDPTIEVTSVTISNIPTSVAVGNRKTLEATVLPDSAFDKTVTWTTSDETIATVSDDGVVTAIAVGEVTITAQAGSCTDTCTFTVVESLPDPLTLEFTAEGTITFNDAPSSLKYSLNDGDTKTAPSSLSVSEGDVVCLYADITEYDGFNIECTSECYVYGNIMSLIDSENYNSSTSLNDIPSAFFGLFQNNTFIKNHETKKLVLPATDLCDYCYANMFAGCTSLTEAPSLPAETLASSCYRLMFGNCTALTSAPDLPATEMEKRCYAYMFYGCTSLTEAPELPAETLAEYCYSGMFQGCTGLTSAPALPALEMAEYSYGYAGAGMFQGCTGLVSAPALPATTLAKGCYTCMFTGCTSLTDAPELSCTELYDYCYSYMFMNCTSLTAAPALPATTLETYCYYALFSGCTNLGSVTCLAADISADRCLTNWLDEAGSDVSTKYFYRSSSVDDSFWSSDVSEDWTIQEVL